MQRAESDYFQQRIKKLEAALRERRRTYRENTEDQIQDLRIAEKRIAELERERDEARADVGILRCEIIGRAAEIRKDLNELEQRAKGGA